MPTTSQGLSFSRNTTYYRQVTHEFNLPAGWACPGAKDCLTKVDRDTGKRTTRGPEFLCYAAVSERYPNVRNQRWKNFDLVKQLCKDDVAVIELPKNATHVRIHGSGDFFNPRYLRLWIRTAQANPEVKFWAFTKSINYLVDYLENEGDMPENFEVQVSRGSKHDALIDAHPELKTATVYDRLDDVPEDQMIDFDDWAAQQPGPSFALLENQANRNQANDPYIAAHNERAAELIAKKGTRN